VLLAPPTTCTKGSLTLETLACTALSSCFVPHHSSPGMRPRTTCLADRCLMIRGLSSSASTAVARDFLLPAAQWILIRLCTYLKRRAVESPPVERKARRSARCGTTVPPGGRPTGQPPCPRHARHGGGASARGTRHGGTPLWGLLPWRGLVAAQNGGAGGRLDRRTEARSASQRGARRAPASGSAGEERGPEPRGASARQPARHHRHTTRKQAARVTHREHLQPCS
jgi:hypothetical protein